MDLLGAGNELEGLTEEDLRAKEKVFSRAHSSLDLVSEPKDPVFMGKAVEKNKCDEPSILPVRLLSLRLSGQRLGWTGVVSSLLVALV